MRSYRFVAEGHRSLSDIIILNAYYGRIFVFILIFGDTGLIFLQHSKEKQKFLLLEPIGMNCQLIVFSKCPIILLSYI